MKQLIKDEKAASIAVEYILTFAISMSLLIALILSSQNLIEMTSDIVMRESFEIIGNDIALKISNMDILIEATFGSGDVDDLNSEFTIPGQIAGRAYSVNISQDRIIIQSFAGSAEARIPLNVTTGIESGIATSSQEQLFILYNSSANKIEVI
ncbi:MAG: hypothetical protein SVM80_07595 [Halobacteriota archaeon]|nr:hypothetical protein [Halobacteriota archaeon]